MHVLSNRNIAKVTQARGLLDQTGKLSVLFVCMLLYFGFGSNGGMHRTMAMNWEGMLISRKYLEGSLHEAVTGHSNQYQTRTGAGAHMRVRVCEVTQSG